MKESGFLSSISFAFEYPSKDPFSWKYFLASSGSKPSGLWMAELYSMMVVILDPSPWKNLAAQYPTLPKP
jgi:hypothetical protein